MDRAFSVDLVHARLRGMVHVGRFQLLTVTCRFFLSSFLHLFFLGLAKEFHFHCCLSKMVRYISQKKKWSDILLNLYGTGILDVVLGSCTELSLILGKAQVNKIHTKKKSFSQCRESAYIVGLFFPQNLYPTKTNLLRWTKGYILSSAHSVTPSSARISGGR